MHNECCSESFPRPLGSTDDDLAGDGVDDGLDLDACKRNKVLHGHSSGGYKAGIRWVYGV